MSDISFMQLPDDVLVTIIANLSLSDLRNLMATCKTLKDLIINNNSIWRAATRRKLIVHNSTDNSQPISPSWYEKCRYSYHWVQGTYSKKIVIYHQTSFMPWLKFHNSQVLFLSVGSELRCYPVDKKYYPNGRRRVWNTVWKVNVPTVRRYDVRTNDISRFVVKKNVIVCGNRDGCAVVYATNNIKNKPFMLKYLKDCHKNGRVEVTAVELINSNHVPHVVTASDSCSEICIWEVPELDDRSNESTNSGPKKINLGDNVGTRCLSVNTMENYLTAGLNGNSQPVLLDTETCKLVLQPNGTKNVKQAVRDVRWHNQNSILFVTHSGSLQMLDIRSQSVVYEVMDPFHSSLYCVKSDGVNAIIVGASEYSRCVLFDARSSARHVQLYFTQKKCSPVYSLDFNPSKLVAAADRSVAVLNFDINLHAVEPQDYSQTFEVISR